MSSLHAHRSCIHVLAVIVCVFLVPAISLPRQCSADPNEYCQRNSEFCSEGDGQVTCNFMKWIMPVAGLDRSSTSVKVDVMNNNPIRPPKGAVDSKTSKDALPDLRLVATKNVRKGHVLLSLPQELMVSSNDLKSNGYRPFSTPPRDQSDIPLVTLASWLLLEKSKGIDSFWHPFIAILPKHIPTPILFSDSLIDEIGDGTLVNELLMRKKDVVSMYESCDPTMVGNATVADFEWAMSVVWSRTFSIMRGSEVDQVMIPFFDFMNHDDDFQAAWQSNQRGGVEMIAVADVEAGQEVFTNYGKKPNSDLFLWYGFVSETNVYDAVPLFADYAEAVVSHVANFSQYEFDDVAIEWADYVARAAMAAVSKAMDAEEETADFLRGTRGMTDRFKDFPFSISTRGRFEPNLMAVIASVWFYDSFREEPDYRSVANLSLLFGYDTKFVTCAVLQDYPDELRSAIMASLAEIYESIRVKLQSFKTTLSEDQEALVAIQECRAGIPSQQPGCAHMSANEWADKEALVRYQIQKKTLLHDCKARILRLCR